MHGLAEMARGHQVQGAFYLLRTLYRCEDRHCVNWHLSHCGPRNKGVVKASSPVEGSRVSGTGWPWWGRGGEQFAGRRAFPKGTKNPSFVAVKS